MNNFLTFYEPFFDWNNWIAVFNSKQDWIIIISLIILECMMSLDNAVVLAAQTKILPDKHEQEKSLLYGLFGAYIFRFIAIGIGSYLIQFWIIKVIGAIYLLYLSISFFIKATDGKNGHSHLPALKKLSLFWRVVISIELMDIAFSVDSVLASLALSENPIILILGGLIGILAMRLIAEVISSIMNKIPELISAAYILIFFIAIKLFLTIPFIGIEIPSYLFLIFTILVFVITIVLHLINNKKV
ncbi:TerC family protein [Companilactobacillus sp. DQM5]|uniref:TerC family protein n=1 Tax=Companilactobacillus sp. DQM5 TaxID=3463359 RepID=UPI00405A1D35